jgi:hypothetical protein
MNTGALNLLVFREARRCVPGPELKQALLDQFSQAGVCASQEGVLRLLLRAGELECGVADSGVPSAPFEQLTGQLAEALVGVGPPADVSSLQDVLGRAPVPEQMSVSAPEGFAYYALHPLLYAEIVESLASLSSSVLVIGIRSIGTTLSAMAAAAVKKTGRAARRMTVRPAGHAYNRRTQFTGQQLGVVQQSLASAADFLIVDEGPGLSGSSFLSVAEALLEAGVPREKITLICGHQPDFDSFCCEDGPQRARRFRWLPVTGALRKPEGADVYIGGGEWRKFLLPEGAAWPASWINFERVKFLSAANTVETRFFKFLGLGHYGDEVLRREDIVADGGFGPRPQPEAHGFASYPRVLGRPMTASDLNEGALARIAEYCAFRQRSFPHEVSSLNSLQQMAEHNLAQFSIDIPIELHLERPVLADGHMQPHEWLLLPGGQMLKSDSGSHGDDHFFPGPTDIAWDLAGAIVEWGMDEPQAEIFLAHYRRMSGDNAKGRITDFVVAYLAFRGAYCLMAANALKGTDEGERLHAEAEKYRAALIVDSATAVVP